MPFLHKSYVSVPIHNLLLQAEKRKLFYIFLKQFLVIYKNWKPVYPGQLAEVAFSAASAVEYTHADDIVVGCSTGHPAEIILAFIQEVVHVTALITECELDFIPNMGWNNS